MELLIVSNRLPVVIEDADSGPRVVQGSGGLVSALTSALGRSGGRWIGWPGPTESKPKELRRLLDEASHDTKFALEAVAIPEKDRRGFYEGFANQIIWPLFHDLQSRCSFAPDYWECYRRVIGRFSEVVAERATADDVVWIHDYHLMGLAAALRAADVRSRLCFFLHIPFPPPDIFAKLPWRSEVLQSLLAHDVLGVQTERDLGNLVDCVRRFMPSVERRIDRGRVVLTHEGDEVVCGAFPIGIDHDEFAGMAATEGVLKRVAQLRDDLRGQQLLLGVDRLDYTKGIPDRLRGFHRALERYPELRRKITFVQLVVPSRETVQEYADLRALIERQVSQINGEFAEPGWTPVQYLFRSVPREELVACYRAADVALVTPLKDGMNLVAKEYCACQLDGNGVLILSEFAGAAAQLDVGAVMVNPFDIERLAESIRRAAFLPIEHRRSGMRRLRKVVRRADVHAWVHHFMAAAATVRRRGRVGRRRARRVEVETG